MPDATEDAEMDQADSAENTELQRLHAGARVIDLEKEERKHLRVIARTTMQANEARVGDGKTVADLNPDYPEEDPVYLCSYESTLNEVFGTRWQQWHGALLAHRVGRRAETYSFPRSRLCAASEGQEGHA